MTEWDDLPQPVRDMVEEQIGPVSAATAIRDGQNCDLAAVVHGSWNRPLFVKGVAGVSRRMRWLRNEITAGELAAGVAPAVLFHVDVEDWLVVGFEYVPGRAASLVPGSPDLALVAATVDKLSTFNAPGICSLRERWSVTDWWGRLAEHSPGSVEGWDVEHLVRLAGQTPELVDGDRLLHTDLHGDQFLIGENGSVHVVDWGWPAAGAPWVDIAFMVIRLVGAGYAPADAEAWARSLSAFGVDNAALTAFAVHVAGLWSYRGAEGVMPAGLGRMACEYVAWRLQQG